MANVGSLAQTAIVNGRDEGTGIEPAVDAPFVLTQIAVADPIRPQGTQASLVPQIPVVKDEVGRPRSQRHNAGGLPSSQQGPSQPGAVAEEGQLPDGRAVEGLGAVMGHGCLQVVALVLGRASPLPPTSTEIESHGFGPGVAHGQGDTILKAPLQLGLKRVVVHVAMFGIVDLSDQIVWLAHQHAQSFDEIATGEVPR